jgi:calcineurin-like phosphoesterase family protein|tara:strand:+ start:1020 stop:1550 length:531 start_codon:yes stop_codon:yes gene_type:complete
MNKEIPKDFYITSDTWFGRPQILQIANRLDFQTIEEMDSTLIKNWNKKVKKNDVVFHLGNFAWDPISARRVLKKLNGTIYFLKGSQDDALVEVINEFPKASILSESIVELADCDLILCHYPLAVWNGKDSGTIHIHGHTVFSYETNLKIENRFNVCTDFWGYTPVNFLTLKDFINA